MKLLDKLVITTENGPDRVIELYQGDLARLDYQYRTDLLIISAYPGSFFPSSTSLIGALYERGLSVEKLAQDKLDDFNGARPCWLSKRIDESHPHLSIKQILCFEPYTTGQPEDVIGEMFNGVIPAVAGTAVDPSSGPAEIYEVISMPLVSTGDLRAPLTEMMIALFDAAVDWLERGLPVRRLRIVERDYDKALEMKGAFGVLKKKYHREKRVRKIDYDVFISYRHSDGTQAMKQVQHELTQLAPDLRLFLDAESLKTGMDWEKKLYQALDSSRKVIALYTKDYVASVTCRKEWNMALLLHHQTPGGRLFPIHLGGVDVPNYWSNYQWQDCSGADPCKIKQACAELVEQLQRE